MLTFEQAMLVLHAQPLCNIHTLPNDSIAHVNSLDIVNLPHHYVAFQLSVNEQLRGKTRYYFLLD